MSASNVRFGIWLLASLFGAALVSQTGLMLGGVSGRVYVARVIDGDTIVLANGDRVRYLGVDTPETVDPRKPVGCYGHEAAAANIRLVEHKYVELSRDTTDRDKYGRLLRFVSVDGLDVSGYLIQHGFGYVYSIEPDVSRLARYAALERGARAKGLGIWGSCGS